MQKNTDEKLTTVKSNPQSETHLVPVTEDCKSCEEKACLYVCPAGVYEWNQTEQKLVVNYENCLECGACRIACTKHSLKWEYPESGYGISYKKG